jgi:uridine phosphorylase
MDLSSYAPILEFDPEHNAILNPHLKGIPDGLPAGCVLCFFQDVLQEYQQQGKFSIAYMLNCEIGENPVYRYQQDGLDVLVCHPGVGAALAAGYLEELIVLGGRKFVVCGGAGSLDTSMDVGHPLVIEKAVRDEGTSYHYLPPSRSVNAGQKATESIEQALTANKVLYTRITSWTTDAFYRETVAKREKRVAEGCKVVEMEAAALFAVAQFRGVELGQVVYAGDLVVPEGWDSRKWQSRSAIRRFLFQMALESCQRI